MENKTTSKKSLGLAQRSFKRSLGQNFLRSESALTAIRDVSDPMRDDIILEIGPGDGVLTKMLLSFAGKVIAIEKDHRLIPILKEKFKEDIKSGKLDLIEKDILDFDINLLKFYTHPYKVIANIPYYITGQIIRMFLESENQPESMTLLLQKEVAQRIIAKDGKESILSISVKIFGVPKYIKTVKKGSFSPQPKVDSAIIHISDISKDKLAGTDQLIFFKILKTGFAHKRKLIIKNLMSRGTLDIDTLELKEIFKECGISEQARAEDLKVEDWVAIARKLT